MTDKDKQFQQLIAKCWSDDAFKQALIADPVTVMRQEGIEVPPEVGITVVENTPTQFHLVIPPAPAELTDGDLEKVAGGFSTHAWCWSF